MHNIDINNDGMPTQKKNNINKFDVVLMNSNIEHPNVCLTGWLQPMLKNESAVYSQSGVETFVV